MAKKRKKAKKVEETDIIESMVGGEAELPTVDVLDEIAIEIDEEVYAKIMHWIDKASGEVSGLGKIEMVNGVFRVTSAILLKQENTSVTTDIDAAAVGKAMFELKDQPGQLNWWWHSHVDMDVFWSGTDLDTIHQIGAGGWFLATVLNKKREMKSAYYQKGNGHLPALFVDDISTSTVFLTSEENITVWDKEFDDKVEEKTYTWTERSHLPGTPSSFPHYGGASIYDASSETHRGRGSRRIDDDFNDDGEMNEMERTYTDEEVNDLIMREINRQERGSGRKSLFKSKKKRNII